MNLRNGVPLAAVDVATEAIRAEPQSARPDEASLRDFMESATVPMHSVSADGTILWANHAELDLFGYSREEYVGTNIAGFHVDQEVIGEILSRLAQGETLYACPSRVRCKSGLIKNIVIDSSALFENGKFVHTRCITRDVTPEVTAKQKLRDAESWYQNLVDALPVAVYTTDAEGNITQYNQEAARLAGRVPQIGKDRWCVAHRLYRADGTLLPREDSPMAVALRTGEPVRGVEAIAERPDGTRTYFMPYPTPLKNEAGVVVGGINVLIDISDRKSEESARARVAAIVETSDDAIISKNLNGIIQTWNAGAQRIFGYEPQEAIGQSVTMLIPDDHANEEPAILERIRRGERVEHYETIRRRKNGSLLNISLTVSPITDARGNIIGASKIARDITHQKRAEAELLRVNADLEQFAYSASHDLQEPIRNVSVYAEILHRRYGQTLDAKGKEAMAFIMESASRMDSLVKGLLAYVQSGGSDDVLESVDVAAALATAVRDLAALVQATHATVTHGDLPSLPMRGGQLENLFQNLIGNAIKYRRDGEAPRIHVTAEPAENDWRFAVQDNGIGVAPEFNKQIFGIFKRLHTDSKYTGTGVGLAICKRIVERHGGRIWVESDGSGNGSTFCFTLPKEGLK